MREKSFCIRGVGSEVEWDSFFFFFDDTEKCVQILASDN